MSCTKSLTIPSPVWAEYWTMDETSGDRIGKVVPTALAPTVPPPTYDTGIQSNCVKFRGADDALVSLSNFATDLFYVAGGFSMVAWVYVDSYAGSSNLLLAWTFTDGGANDLSFWLRIDDSGVTNIRLDSDIAGTVTQAFAKPAVGTWTLYHAYYDPTTLKIGLQINNGVPVETDASGVTMVVPTIASVDFQRGSTVANPELEGRIDEVGLVVDRVLTKTQVDWLYNSGAGRTWPEVTQILLH